MTPPVSEQATVPEAAAYSHLREELPEPTDKSGLPTAIKPANEATCTRSSFAETDPLLSLLRGGLLPPTPVVHAKRNVQAEKTQLLKEKIENARLVKAKAERAKAEKAEFVRAQAERAKFEKAQLEAVKLENAEYEKAHAERAKFERERAESVLPETAQPGNAKSETLPQADSLLSLLRKEMLLPLAPDAPVKPDAKTERANPQKVRLEKTESEKAESESIESKSAESKAPLPDGPARSGRRGVQAVAAAILVLACVAGVLFLCRGRLFRVPLLLAPGDRLMVAAVENRTGDPGLDGAVSQALEFELQQSPNLALRGSDAFRAAARQLVGTADGPPSPVLARQAAHAAGAKAYLYGTLRASGTAYILSVDILDAVNNRKLVELQQTAASRDRIPQAIERIAATLRSRLVSDSGSHPGKGIDGKVGGPPLRSDVPLNMEATADLEALHDYSLGENAELDGRTDDAVAAFQSVAAIDPKFIQAQMQLSWLYRQRHMQAASATAAQLAEQVASSASQRTSLLARYTYEVNSTGDLLQADAAIRRFVALYPHDPQGALGLARLRLLQDRTAEALDAAQRGLAADPYDAELYQQAELALIRLDRNGEAQALQQQSQSMRLEPAVAPTH